MGNGVDCLWNDCARGLKWTSCIARARFVCLCLCQGKARLMRWYIIPLSSARSRPSPDPPPCLSQPIPVLYDIPLFILLPRLCVIPATPASVFSPSYNQPCFPGTPLAPSCHDCTPLSSSTTALPQCSPTTAHLLLPARRPPHPRPLSAIV